MSAGKGSMIRTEPVHSRKDVPVTFMSDPEKGSIVVERAVKKVNGELVEEIPGIVVGVVGGIVVTAAGGGLAVWAASHFVGVGFLVDAAFVLGAGLTAITAFQCAAELNICVSYLRQATTQVELTISADHLAKAMKLVGVELITSLLTAGIGMIGSAVGRSSRFLAATVTKSGMLDSHFQAVRRLAKEMDLVIIFRNSNPNGMKWMQLGFPRKPGWMGAVKTGKSPTGLATASFDSPKQMADVAKALELGHYFVGADGVPRNLTGQALTFRVPPEWPLEPGQIIHGKALKPFVSDYDMLGVINPNSPNTVGDVVDFAAGYGKRNVTTPAALEVLRRLNQIAGEDIAMHGEHELFMALDKAGDCTAFFPDDIQLNFSAAEVSELFRYWGRPSL